MIAVYTPTREGATALNVRTAPDPASDVIDAIEPGEPVEVVAVRRGWCELAGGGWADARFLDVEEGAAYDCDKKDAAPAEATADEAPEVADDAEGDAPEALQDMTVAQLKELAEKSGVKLKKDMRKDEIIAAVLEGEND